MNLYKSFGNLLETWVAEGSVPGSRDAPEDDDEEEEEEEPWLGREEEDEEDPADAGGGGGGRSADTNDALTPPLSLLSDGARSESVDSGVELTSASSSDCTSLPSPSPDTDPVPVPGPIAVTSSSSTRREQEEDRNGSPPRLSSSSSSRAERSAALHRKVEQALQRTEEPSSRTQSLRHRQPPSPPSSSPSSSDLRWQRRRWGPKKKSSSLVVRRNHVAGRDQHHHAAATGQRSASLGRKGTKQQQQQQQQHTSGHSGRPLSMHHTLPHKSITENSSEKRWEGLSPGLSYLERVCQMLEEIARLKQDNRDLQQEMDALLESKQAMQATESLCCDCKAIAEEPLSSELCEMNSDENFNTETQWPSHSDNNDAVFRRRSASDTNVLAQHLRRVKPSTRGQHMDINDLFEQAEDHETQEETDKQTHSGLETDTQRRDKAASLSDSERNCPQTQPSQKKKASRHRLSQLFRRRRKTIPI